MYNYVYWFFFKFFAWRNKFESYFLPSNAVLMVIIIHITLIYFIIKRFTGWTVNILTSSSGTNKLILFPIILSSLVIFYFAYHKNAGKRIIKKYEEKKWN